MGFDVQLFLQHILEHDVSVLVIEGGQSSQHFIQECPQTPVVHRLVVSSPREYLGSQVFRSAAERIGLLIL